MGKQNKCEKHGFQHAWEEIKSNMVYPTIPPQYPPRKQRCINCGLIRILKVKQHEIKEWESQSK